MVARSKNDLFGKKALFCYVAGCQCNKKRLILAG